MASNTKIVGKKVLTKVRESIHWENPVRFSSGRADWCQALVGWETPSIRSNGQLRRSSMTYRSQQSPRLAALALAALGTGSLVDRANPVSSARLTTKFTDKSDSGSAHLQNVGTVFADHAGGAEYLAALTHEQFVTDIAGAKGAKKIRGPGVKKATCIGIDGVGVPGAAAKKAMNQAGVGIGASCDEASVFEIDGSAQIGAIQAASLKMASGAACRRHWRPKKWTPLGSTASMTARTCPC